MNLRQYQMEDLTQIIKHTSYGIFNEQRTGKTPTTIVAMEKQGAKRILVVCPASLSYVWCEEYKHWTGKKAVVITSAKKLLDKGADLDAPVWIINYENLRGTQNNHNVLRYILNKYKPDGLIVDEAHRCKSRDSLNFYAINALNHVKFRYYLTGTPAPNRPYDVWSILHFIDPTTFRSYWKFIEQYFTITLNAYSPFHPPVREIGIYKEGMDVELAKVIETYSVQRKRKDVMPWLPEEEKPTVIRLPLTKYQEKYIRQLEDTFEIGETVECEGVLERLIRVRQVCAAPEILSLKGSSPKLDWVKQYLSDYPDKSVLIFSNSTKLLQLLYANVVHCPLIIGKTKEQDRHSYIKGFQSGIIRVLGIQTQAGKEGLTLDMADVTIFLDTYPPAADYQQAKDRMVATSPERVKPKEIIHLMMKDSYDEELYHLVDRNISQTEVINDYINYLKRRLH